MREYNLKDFDYEFLVQAKKQKTAIVFSTYDEREADLICEKIELLQTKVPKLIDTLLISHRRNENTNKKDATELAVEALHSKAILLLCNSYQVSDMGKEAGKGADMRRALHYLITQEAYGIHDIIVYLDADVTSEHFDAHFIYALIGPIICDGVDFSKASFYRQMGRVKKFVAQPLFSLVQHEKLDLLCKFSYPLSGEVAGTIEFFTAVNFWQMYGVETGVNIDAVFGDFNIADINLGYYDHAHSSDTAIQKMCFGIMRTYFKKLEQYGLIEFKKGATISDVFFASSIDERLERSKIASSLEEKMYAPLKMLDL